MHSPISGDCVSVGAHASQAIGTSASGQSASAGIVVSHNSARLSGIDAARGIAMLLVCLSHIRYHFEAMPEVYTALTLVTRAATPTFLLLSGFVAAIVLAAGGARARIALIDRALCVLIVGHLLLNLEQVTQVDLSQWLFGRVTVTDAIAVCLIMAAICWRVPAYALLLLGTVFALISWPIAMSASVHNSAAEYLMTALFNIRSAHTSLVDAALVPYLGVFLIGMGLSTAMKEDVQQRRTTALARRLFVTSAGSIAAVALSALLWHFFKDAINSSIASPELAATVRQTLDPRQKLPPSPGYLLFYSGVGLAIAGVCLSGRPRALVAPVVAWTAVLGRASLMAFVVQDWLLRFVPIVFGFDDFQNSAFWICYLLLAVLTLHWLASRWDAARGNRFLTVGLKRLARSHDPTPPNPVGASQRPLPR